MNKKTELHNLNFNNYSNYQGWLKSYFGKLTLLRQRKIIFSLLGLLLILGMSFFLFLNGKQSPAKSQQVNQIKTPLIKSSININQEFVFPLTTSVKNSNNIVYTIESAEIRNQIVVKGQKATAVEGKTFLIINLKLKNSQNQNITLNTRDYIRIASGNNNEEWLAPEIHNDPVEVQAISTKYTRLGFPVSIDDKQFKMQVGEINGEKQTIDLNFN